MALDYQTNNPISRKSCTMNNRIILYSMIDILFFLFFFFVDFWLFYLTRNYTAFLSLLQFRVCLFSFILISDCCILYFYLFSLFCFYIISCFHIFICVRSIFGMIHSYEDIYIYAKSEFTKIFKMHIMIHKKHHNIAFNISHS